MNFFKAQDQARRYTTRLVFLFILAVAVLIALTNLLVLGVISYINLPVGQVLSIDHFKNNFEWPLFFAVGGAIVLIVACGSLYKISQLSAGGRVVAEALGGKLINANTTQPQERQLLNIVEEMALASGTPVPPVYLLYETGINAFAAGYSPGNAVIGITRGALNELNRDQIQGVIAHEFSHILNGDMRLNTRLIGILNGILILGIIGYYILRGTSSGSHYRSSSRSSGNGAIVALALGLGLIIIGYSGTFFGNMIKASVSRQREYLADASAVQFTRNPDSIAGALIRIGGYKTHAYINSPAANEVSHAFFCNGIKGFLGSIFATHPPLEERIRKIKPQWDGQFDKRPPTERFDTPASLTTKSTTPQENAENLMKTVAVVSAAQEAINNIERAGQVNEKDIDNAHHLIQSLDPTVLAAAREPYGAGAVIYNLVISTKPDIRKNQFSILDDNADTGIHAYTQKLLPLMENIKPEQRLPLIDLAMPALRQLSLTQYQRFNKNLTDLIIADKKINLFEWALQKVVLHYLDDAFIKKPLRAHKYKKLVSVKNEISHLVGLLAYAGHKQTDDIEKAFQAANYILDFKDNKLPAKKDINLDSLNRAIDKLALLQPLVKPQLLKACVACIESDGQITPREAELLRAFSSVLDCPLPPTYSQNTQTT